MKDDSTHNSTEKNADTARQRVIDTIAARFKKRGRERTAAPSESFPRKAVRVAKHVLIAASVLGWGNIGYNVASAYLTAPVDNMMADTSRPLTVGEQALAKAVFGDTFDTNDVTLRFHDGAPRHFFTMRQNDYRASALAYVNRTAAQDIHFVDTDFHAKDYSRANDMGLRGGVFIHEMAHVWQARQATSAPFCTNYDFTLTDQSKFEDFCNEQQAEILRSYVMRFIIPSHPLMAANAQANALMAKAGSTRQMALSSEDHNLARVVEQVFPHARTSRLHIMAGFNAAATCALDRAVADNSMSYAEHFNACAAVHVRTVNGERLELPSYQAQAEVAPQTAQADHAHGHHHHARPARAPQPG